MTTLPQTTTTMKLPREAGVGGGAGLMAPVGLSHAGASQMTAADVWRVIRSNIWLIVISVAVAGVIGVGLNEVLKRVHPRWTATGVVEINPYAERDPRQIMATSPSKETILVEQRTQASKMSNEQLFSDLLQLPTIRETGWYKSFTKPEDAKQDLVDNVRVSPVPDTRLIQVSMSAADPGDARLILDELVSLHIRNEQRRALETNLDRGQVLGRLKDEMNARRNDIVRDLHRAQAELATAGSGLPGTGGVSPKDLEMMELVKRALELRAAAEMSDSQYQGVMETLKRGEEPPMVSERLGTDPMVMRYRQMLDEIDLQLAGLNPDILGDSQTRTNLLRKKEHTQKAMDDYKAEMGQTYQAQLLDTLRSTAASSQAQLSAVEDRINELKQQMGDLKQYQVDYLRLQDEDKQISEQMRDLQSEIALVNEITRKEKSAGVNWATRPPKPDIMSFPRMPITVALMVFLGLALSVGIAFLREMLDTSVRSPRDIARVGQLNLLGMISDESEDQQATQTPLELIIALAPHSIMAEQFRQLRTRLHHTASLDTTRSILLTSPSPEDGTTTVAVNLAAGLALNGRRILLVDANFRRPALHSIFKLPMERGFSDALVDIEQLPNLAHETEIPNLDLLTSGAKPANPTELLESQLFIDLIDRCLDKYDHVIFDSGPMLFVSDTVAMAPRVDGVISVVRARNNSRGVLQRLRDDLRKLKAEHLGVVLNAVKHHAGGYYSQNIKTYYEYAQPRT
ncbi:MAG: polysaccharide biosynthesis tyrosine autokinase [Phycisphaerales bacterium]|nr:polysaccharide biosynthesis tyrosine autokinase [Phycisphaerales bacterium]